ncbi:MAG: hypothetical protein IT519_16685 [Burkholderiales bacterium]|nr:hypothetical protein [Burkholderiales bacterium]
MEMRTIRLLRRHTRAGQEYAIGVQLVIPKRDAEWLVEQKIADPVGWQFAGSTSEVRAPVQSAGSAKSLVPARKGCCGHRW